MAVRFAVCATALALGHAQHDLHAPPLNAHTMMGRSVAGGSTICFDDCIKRPIDDDDDDGHSSCSLAEFGTPCSADCSDNDKKFLCDTCQYASGWALELEPICKEFYPEVAGVDLSCIDGWGCKDPLVALGSCSEPATQYVCEYCYNDGAGASSYSYDYDPARFEPVCTTYLPTLEPSPMPTFPPTSTDTASVEISLVITASAPPVDADKAALKTSIANATKVEESALKGFQVTVSARRRLQTARSQEVEARRLAIVTWDVALTLVVGLSTTSVADGTDLASFVVSALTSPSFESAVAAAVTGAVLDTGSVATVVLTRAPSATPTAALMATLVVANVATSTPSKEDDDDVSLSSLSLLSLAVGVAVVLLLCSASVYCGVFRRGKSSKCHSGRVGSLRDSTSPSPDGDPQVPKKGVGTSLDGVGVDDEPDSRAFYQL